MRSSLLALFVVGLLVACSTTNASNQDLDLDSANDASVLGAAGTYFEPGEGVLIAGAIRLAATVVSVDRHDRSIVVKAADGRAQKIELTEDVKNFDQIRTGDEVVVEVYTGLAMRLAEPGQEFDDVATGLVAVAQPGDKPKMVIVDVVEVLARITDIERSKREVTVTGPLGKSVTLQVPEDVKRFDELKIGDEVNARYTEAFAVSVQKTN